MNLSRYRSVKAYIPALLRGRGWTGLIWSPAGLAFVLLLALAAPSALAKDESCQAAVTNAEEPLKTASVGEIQLQYRHIKTFADHLLTKEVFGSEDDLLLAFNGAGHAYVQQQGVRVDGQMIGRRTKVRPHTIYVDEGVVIRIPGVEADRAMMKSYRYRPNISCAGTACSVMSRAAGIRIGKGGGMNTRPDKLLLRILKEGLYTEDGTAVPFDVFVIGNDNFVTRYQRYYRNSDQMNFTYWVALPAVTAGALAVGALTIMDILK